ncbi:MAG: ABC transporter permease [Gemmatimonadota bacterium]
MKPVILWTDWAVLIVLVVAVLYAWRVRRTPHLAATWRKAFLQPVGASTATLLAIVVAIGVLDSLHFREQIADEGGRPVYSPVTRSALDVLLTRQESGRETTYSEPLDYLSYQKESMEVGGKQVRDYPRLKYGGAHLHDPVHEWAGDILRRGGLGLAGGALASALLAVLVALRHSRRQRRTLSASLADIARGRTEYPVRAVLVTLGVLLLLAGPIATLSAEYHVFGTDRTGNDLLYLVLKSIRTALVIGTMTTLVTLPIAVGLGIAAGYLRGWVDEVIQYLYTVLNSIPYLLLLAAAVLILIIFIDNNPELFQTAAERTDARLFFLCVILGVTSWTELARLIRAEVLRLRELEYVQAAQAFGVSTWRIMTVHLVPNLMHVILINVVIAFSGLVLAEAILSYVGVGVDPSMASFGTLINTARAELSREPAIWWTLATAFTFMFVIVLSANLFADAVRDAFDPRFISK